MRAELFRFARVADGDDLLDAFGIAAGDAENQAVIDLGVEQELRLDGAGIELASGDVNEVASAPAKGDRPVRRDLGQVAGEKL